MHFNEDLTTSDKTRYRWMKIHLGNFMAHLQYSCTDSDSDSCPVRKSKSESEQCEIFCIIQCSQGVFELILRAISNTHFMTYFDLPWCRPFRGGFYRWLRMFQTSRTFRTRSCSWCDCWTSPGVSLSSRGIGALSTHPEIVMSKQIRNIFDK